ncbi:MAG: cupin protein [Solirubrobacterales bacterium]|nr:cupin protein [Solirubrobacterales bacterium]
MANERLTFGEVSMEVLATADSTAGAMTAIVETPPLADTPAHVHANEDELFVALEGEHAITVGDEESTIGPGEAVFAPRGIPHSQRRVVEGEGRIMFVCTPGGLEGFFRELARADADGTLGPDTYAAASERYGITWL